MAKLVSFLEGIVDGESAPGQGEGAEEGVGWCEDQAGARLPSTLAGGKGSGVAGCGDVGVQGPVLP